MADRKRILWGITNEEDRLFLSKMCDIAEKSFDSGRVMFSRFLNPGQRLIAESRMKTDFNMTFFGGYEDAERVVASFGELLEDMRYPIVALKVEAKGKKTLSHRDYLGSVLSLGIKREHMGDVLVKDDGAVIFLTEEIADFVMMNLSRIASAPVKLSIIEDMSQLESERRFKETQTSVSSMRLDCVLSAVTGKSRSQSTAIIEEGICTVNYSPVKNVRTQIKDGDIISVRGFGKFVVETDNSLTKKGRVHLKAKKYI